MLWTKFACLKVVLSFFEKFSKFFLDFQWWKYTFYKKFSKNVLVSEKFFLLNNFCFAWFRRVKKECIDTIIGKSYVGDWFLFYLLGQNIDSVIFKVNVKFIRNPLFRHQTHFLFDMRVCEWVCFATSLFQSNKIITKYLQKKSVPKIFNDKIDLPWNILNCSRYTLLIN